MHLELGGLKVQHGCRVFLDLCCHVVMLQGSSLFTQHQSNGLPHQEDSPFNQHHLYSANMSPSQWQENNPWASILHEGRLLSHNFIITNRFLFNDHL